MRRYYEVPYGWPGAIGITIPKLGMISWLCATADLYSWIVVLVTLCTCCHSHTHSRSHSRSHSHSLSLDARRNHPAVDDPRETLFIVCSRPCCQGRCGAWLRTALPISQSVVVRVRQCVCVCTRAPASVTEAWCVGACAAQSARAVCTSTASASPTRTTTTTRCSTAGPGVVSASPTVRRSRRRASRCSSAPTTFVNVARAALRLVALRSRRQVQEQGGTPRRRRRCRSGQRRAANRVTETS